jgi:hypothetical protein
MNHYSQSFRERESARTVRSLLATGVPLLLAVELCAEAYELSIGDVLGAWGSL